MADENAAVAEPPEQPLSVHARGCVGEHEVRLGLRHRETELGERDRQAAALTAHGVPPLAGVAEVDERRLRRHLGDGVDVVAVAGFGADRLHQPGGAEKEPHAKTRKRIALGKRSEQQHVVVGGQQGREVVAEPGINEVHVCLVHQQHAIEFSSQAGDGPGVQENAGRRVGIHNAGQSRPGGVHPLGEVAGQRPIGRQLHAHHVAVLHGRQHGTQGIARLGGPEHPRPDPRRS